MNGHHPPGGSPGPGPHYPPPPPSWTPGPGAPGPQGRPPGQLVIGGIVIGRHGPGSVLGGLLCVTATVLGFFVPFTGDVPFRPSSLWSWFALAAAAVVALASFAPSPGSWRVLLGGTLALSVHWLLISLPSIGTSENFLHTVALIGAWVAVALSPGRP